MDKIFKENIFHIFQIKLKIILLISEKLKKNELSFNIDDSNV